MNSKFKWDRLWRPHAPNGQTGQMAPDHKTRKTIQIPQRSSDFITVPASSKIYPTIKRNDNQADEKRTVARLQPYFFLRWQN